MSHLIIDGHNYLWRSFSVPFKYNSAKGVPLHVAATFVNLLKRAVRTVDAADILVVFDSPGASSNHLLSAEYKSNRVYDFAEGESPFDHIPLIRQMLDLLEIPWIELPGTEADDIIATIATKHKASNQPVVIGSTDSDFYQLLCDTIQILKLESGGSHQIVDAVWVEQKYGVTPAEYVELKCWVGDKSDNIVGIAGIGWKRGTEIIRQQRTRELNPAELELLALNRQLITLNTDVDVEIQSGNIEKLIQITTNQMFVDLDV